jgi:hypothetical protein
MIANGAVVVTKRENRNDNFTLVVLEPQMDYVIARKHIL